nr:hypothetical protein [uncultured Roseateles sp.]
MNGLAFGALMLNELRLRLRRLSTLVVLLAVVLLSWLMVVDPASGEAMITVGDARVVYDSTALAAGTATLGSLLMGLVGFFLLRGRSQEELRAGSAAVLAATPVLNALLLIARWAGGLAYLCGLMLALLLTMFVLHAVRGEGAIEPGIYLQMYGLQLLPGLMFGAGMATLADAWAPLMGKRGDLLYFMLWLAQLGTLPASLGQASIPSWTLLDTSGLALLPSRLEQLTGQSNISIGASEFNAALPALQLPADFWTAQMVGMRAGSALLSLLPLLLALLLFHRFSPDKVRPGVAHRRFAALDWLQQLSRPLASMLGRLLMPAARVPGLAGQVLADALITLMASPVAVPLLATALMVGALCDREALPGLLTAAVAVWGVLISDLSVRDHQSGTSALGAAVPGGFERRPLRLWLAGLLLGLLFTAPVLLRWLVVFNPTGALALLAGLAALSAIAGALGQFTRTGRCFLALFLFGLYVSTQVRQVAWMDAVGINGAANGASISVWLLAGLVALAASHLAMQGRGWTAARIG